MRNYLLAMSVCVVLSVVLSTAAIADTTRPNVILIMTDDQGWGEVGFHGNKTIKTPNLDRFAAEGTELTHFYVSPMCTPTRSSLMTGRYHFGTGAHDTYIGRSNMNPQETTMAEIFAGAGYRTGIFGKWHLGENYPMRAVDQGFQTAVVHGGGGIGQFADYPGNSYWDPTLLYNDTFKKAKGYCTDVFIDESIRFIRDNRGRPFFCYIPLNIPHSPFVVHARFQKPYEKIVKEKGRQWTAPIYGMITQFDGAFQRLLDAVDEMGIKQNTIIIFMTDNGPNSVYFTAGLRAKKGSVYENGIRSPFVIQWPKGMKGGRKFNDPAMHIDLLPTLADACGIQLPADLKVDGQSILPLLTGKAKRLPDRTDHGRRWATEETETTSNCTTLSRIRAKRRTWRVSIPTRSRPSSANMKRGLTMSPQSCGAKRACLTPSSLIQPKRLTFALPGRTGGVTKPAGGPRTMGDGG